MRTHARTSASQTDRPVGPGRAGRAEGSPGKEHRMDATLFGRLGGFAVRRRWFVIATWAVLLVTMGTFARGLSDRLTSGGFEVPGSPSLAVQHDLQKRFTGQYPYTALVVVHSGGATVRDPAFQGEIRTVASEVEGTKGVGAVQSFLSTQSPVFVSADGHTTYLVAGLKGSQNDVLSAAGRVMQAARRSVPSGFQVETGGLSAFY